MNILPAVFALAESSRWRRQAHSISRAGKMAVGSSPTVWLPIQKKNPPPTCKQLVAQFEVQIAGL